MEDHIAEIQKRFPINVEIIKSKKGLFNKVLSCLGFKANF